jgi:DNA-binding response OmpR family regulator
MQIKSFVLTIDRDQSYANALEFALGREGYAYRHVKEFGEAQPLLSDPSCQAVVIGRNLEGASGLQLAKILRSEPVTSKLIIILVASVYDEYDVIEGLDAGVDDYMGKPLRPIELVCRFKAIRRRRTNVPMQVANSNVKIGALSLKADDSTAHVNGQALKLTQSEFRILQRLVQTPERVFSRVQLLSLLPSGADNNINNSYPNGDQHRKIDVHIKRIRSELLKFEASPQIQTVRGEGYFISEVRAN